MSNEILCNNYTFRGNDILSGNAFIGNSLVGEELAIDTFEFEANLKKFKLLTSDGEVLKTSDGETLVCHSRADDYKFGDPAVFKHDGTLIGKFYLEQPPIRTGKTTYRFPTFSAIGLLDRRTHYGGLYRGTPAGDIIAELMGDIPYTIDPAVAAVPIFNLLPVATRRENLHQVLFAIGAGVFKDIAGEVVIKFITSSDPVLISEDRIYVDGTVDPKTPATRVVVVEHATFETDDDQTVTLFETAENVESEVVLFDQPCYDFVATGLTIKESNCNYAIVSGTGTLQGKAYTRTKKEISLNTGIVGKENVVRIENNTLITSANSFNVARRVAQYFSAVSTTTVGLVVGEERPATEISYVNPFGEEETGYIKSLDITLSAKLKAMAEIAKGFLPTGQGNIFNNYKILTGTGTWTVPEGVTRIRAIAVERGQPGEPGEDGKPGTTASGGAGGQPGEGGAGGKVLEINKDVTPGQVFSYSCDEHAVFDGISAETGSLYPSGYFELVTGLLLGKKGRPGDLAGGAGSGASGPGPSVTKGDTTYYPGPNGSSYTAYGITAYGGFGGGAASAGNGSPGQDGYVQRTGGYTETGWILIDSGLGEIPNGPLYYSDWQESYWFNSTTGMFSTYGPSGFAPDRRNVYKSYGSYCMRASIVLGGDRWYLHRNDATGSPITGVQVYGGGGQGGPGAAGADATGYGEGGQGGDGGGGGGQSRGYDWGFPGPGGPGGPGGSGGPAVIIVLF